VIHFLFGCLGCLQHDPLVMVVTTDGWLQLARVSSVGCLQLFVGPSAYTVRWTTALAVLDRQSEPASANMDKQRSPLALLQIHALRPVHSCSASPQFSYVVQRSQCRQLTESRHSESPRQRRLSAVLSGVGGAAPVRLVDNVRYVHG
jgi:hypothetical protein